MNTIILFVFIVLFAIVLIFAVPKLLTLGNEEVTEAIATDETLEIKRNEHDALASTIAEIERKEKEKETLRLRLEEAQRKKDEANKRKAELEAQAEADRLAKEQAEKNKQAESEAPPVSLPPQSISTASSRSSDEKRPPTPQERKRMGSGLIMFSNNSSAEAEDNSDNTVSDSLKGGNYAKGTTNVLENMDMLLNAGTQIPCVLKTKVVTSYKGAVICQVTRDVYSSNGTTVLVDRGSEVFGEQKTSIDNGVARVFLSWNTITTPYGVRVRIDSLGTDALGASGAEGYVDNHWVERFGSAIMLSMIDDALSVAASRASKSGDVTYDNSTNNASEMASKALEHSINIPPTIYINQGELMNILVVRDVYFDEVYSKVR